MTGNYKTHESKCRHAMAHAKRAVAHSSTFVFCRRTKPEQKTKRTIFAIAINDKSIYTSKFVQKTECLKKIK